MAKKRLIICCDGTWNEPATRTNVWRIKNAIATRDERGDEPIMQWVYYDPGVGTERLNKFTGGLLGVGLSENVKEAYSFLVEHYASGGEIWCFGFSRGAYTVRSLCGMIGVAGLLRNRDIVFIDQAFDYYRTPKEDRERTDYHQLKQDLLLRTFEGGLRVRMLGVFDTVGALGVPIPWLKRLTQWRAVTFHDTELSPLIENAYQALAVDERRGPFTPTLWTAAPTEGQDVRQVWFPGVHSDVGGGYDDKRCGDVVLEWMLDAAWSKGLLLRDSYVHRDVKPDVFGPLHDSMTSGWQIVDWLPGIAKSGARPIGSEQRRSAGLPPVAPETEYLHWSVEARIADAESKLAAPYRPSNLCNSHGQLHDSVSEGNLQRENRRAVRFRPDEPCTVDGKPAELVNLSRLGARLRLSDPPPSDAALEGRPLPLVSPSLGERPVSLVWRQGHDLGVAFADAA